MGLFIVFEGCEGAGKSVQARRLYQRILREGVDVVLTHEPGGTELGKRIRALVKGNAAIGITPLAELFLFLASREQLVTEVIRPCMECGVVICDRFIYSSVAYQGYGRGLDISTIEMLNTHATQGLLPDVVILMDISPEVGLVRKSSSRTDRFEEASLDFHQRVRDGYLKMATEDPMRWMVMDATLSESALEAIVWDRVKPLIEAKLGTVP